MKPRLVRLFSLLVLASMALTAQVARQEPVVPLKNWATPLYWQPSQTERAATGAAPQLQFSSNQVSASALTFIAITPCRLVDTRGAVAGFNGISPFSGPAIGPMTAVTFPVQSATEASADTTPAPCGTIPSIAQAYSLNLTVVPVAGGTVDYISMWPSGYSQPFVATLNDPQGAIVANAAIVPAGTTSGGISVYNQGPATANVIIDMNGFFAAPTDLNFNTAVGAGALLTNTTAVGNTAIGVDALANNTSGNENTAMGLFALVENTTGAFNQASGFQAMATNTVGDDNTADGVQALFSNTSGNQNTAIGRQSLYSNTTASFNTASGSGALQNNTTGSNNTATGYFALQSNTTASGITAVGYQALQSNTTGISNAALGFEALLANTTGFGNTATGYSALAANTTGNGNTGTGTNALTANTTGVENTAIGYAALGANTTGGTDTAIGEAALAGNTTGTNNTATGQAVLLDNTTGNNNTATGQGALFANTTGGDGTAFGLGALSANTTGTGNIAIGYLAAASVSGANGNNIHIGNVGASGDSNVIKIGTSQTSAYIAGIYGESVGSTNSYICVDNAGKLGTLSGGCASLSSRRFKEQITDMGDSSSNLLQLRPVTFFYKPQYDDGSHTLQYGLIAEEVAKLYPEMVGYDQDGQPNSVKYQALAPMLLNEVQKQNAALQSQQAENRKLEEQNRNLENRLAAVETLLSSQASKPASSQ